MIRTTQLKNTSHETIISSSSDPGPRGRNLVLCGRRNSVGQHQRRNRFSVARPPRPQRQDHRQCSGALERDAGAGKLRSGRKTRLADPLRRRRTGRVLRDRRDLCRESGSCPQCVASFLLRRKDPGFHRLAKCGRHGIRRPGLLFLHFGRNHADPLFGPAPAFARQTELRLLRTRKHLRRRRISRPGLRVPRRRPHGP